MDYWKECISEACEDAGLKVSDAQIDVLVSWIEGAHENYGMAHGHDAIPNPLAAENDALRQQLKAERDKVLCEGCGGSGRIITHGPIHSSDSECSRCRGYGRHAY